VADDLLPGNDGGVASFAVSDDGILAFAMGPRGGEPVVVSASGTERDLPGPRVFGYMPTVSPDGRRVAVGAATEWKDGFWIKNLETGVVEQRAADSLTHHPQWSGDGRRLIYGVAPDHWLASRPTAL